MGVLLQTNTYLMEPHKAYLRRQIAAAIWEYKGKWEIEFQDTSVISHVAT
jgi:hypothetical protein